MILKRFDASSSFTHSIARRIITHKMTPKLLQNGVGAWKVTPLWLDEALCDFLDVGNVKRHKWHFFMSMPYLLILYRHMSYLLLISIYLSFYMMKLHLSRWSRRSYGIRQFRDYPYWSVAALSCCWVGTWEPYFTSRLYKHKCILHRSLW